MAIFLVTGGAGFIGSNIVGHLLGLGEKVRVLDNYSTGRDENLEQWRSNPNLEIIRGDIRNYTLVREVSQGCDFILHQAALPSVPRSIKDPISTNEVNVLGTLNVLEAARDAQVKRVVYASSSSVYGNSEMMPKHEEMPVNPLSPYALSKYAGEKYCQIYHSLYGMETVALRYFNVFGPNQDPNSEYSAVIPKFIKAVSEKRPPVIYGDGLQSRDFTYVQNNVEANILACYSDAAVGGVFNIACGKQYTLLDLVETIAQHFGSEVRPLFAEARPGDVKHSLASIEKAQQSLNYKVSVPFEQGLSEYISHSLRTDSNSTDS